MPRIVNKIRLGVALIAICSLAATLRAAPPADTLVPATTKAFFSVPGFPDANARWHKTRLGQLIADPALDPFFEDLRRQVRDKWFKNKSKIGTTWDDFEKAASGEVALALIHAPRTNPAMAMIADVTDRVPQAQQLLNKVAQDMINQQGRQARVQVAGVNVNAFEFPPEESGQPPQHAYYTIVSNLLIGTDEMSAMNEILRRVAAPATPGAIVQSPVYQAVLQRAAKVAKDNHPQARWFIEPIGLMSAIEAEQPQQARPGAAQPRVLTPAVRCPPVGPGMRHPPPRRARLGATARQNSPASWGSAQFKEQVGLSICRRNAMTSWPIPRSTRQSPGRSR